MPEPATRADGWHQTEWGERNHAVTSTGFVLCGIRTRCDYPPDPNGLPCARCVEMAGPAMPPPPGLSLDEFAPA